MTREDVRVPLAIALQALRDDLATKEPPAAAFAAVQAATSSRGEAPAGRATIVAARASLAARPRFEWRWPAWTGAAAAASMLTLSLLLLMRQPDHAARWADTQARLAVDAAPSARTRPGPEGEGGTDRWAHEPMPTAHFVPLVSAERLRALAGADGNAGVARGAGGPHRPSTEAAHGSAWADGAAAAWVLTAEVPYQRLASFGLPYDPTRAGELLRAELLVAGNGDVLAVRLLH